MRRPIAPRLVCSALLALASNGCSHGSAPDGGAPVQHIGQEDTSSPGPGEGLIVHEWGTFTAMVGSRGVSLDGLHHASDKLPDFVHSLLPAPTPSPFHAFGDHSYYPPARNVDGKMETPVLYFYTKDRQRVSVHVDFNQGLLTEWYPEASRVAPEKVATPVDVAQIPRSSLDWDLDVTPAERGAPAAMPHVDAEDPWQFAREVHADYVTPLRKDGTAIAGEAEHYVFYRGLGRLSLPVNLRYCRDQIKAQNSGDAPVPFALALQMTEAGGRFVTLGQVNGHGGEAVIDFQAPPSPKEAIVEAVGREMQNALIAEGLYADEARAMIRTWSPTWFASEGTRVLYILPRSATDAILPIQITPAPTKLVRVLVGRQEILSREREAEVESLLEDRASADPARRAAADKGLARFGRFLEPAVRQAVAWAGDEAVQKSGRDVLSQFR